MSRFAPVRASNLRDHRKTRRLYRVERFLAESNRSSTRTTSSNSTSCTVTCSSLCAFDTIRGFGFCFVCATRECSTGRAVRVRFAIAISIALRTAMAVYFVSPKITSASDFTRAACGAA